MSLRDRSIAMAGCVQHAWWAHRLAQHGEYRVDRLREAADSIFCTDPDNAQSVFGGLDHLKPGLETAAFLLSGQRDGPIPPQESALITGYTGQLLRLGVAVWKQPRIQKKLGEGIAGIKRDCPSGRASDRTAESTDMDALTTALARLYAENISPLTPRIMVQGNGIYLRNELFAAGIRTHLLAAVRAAVLWRQCGGSLWMLMFQRGSYLRQIRELAAGKSI